MKRLPILVLLVLLLFGLYSCTTLSKSTVDKSHADVISKLHNKARKGKLDRTRLIDFEKALQEDLYEELKLLNSNLASEQFEDWRSGYIHLDALEKKQERYLNYPQLNSYNIEFVDVNYWDRAFRDKLYSFHINNYSKHYEKFMQTNNKNLVIDAYYELQKVAHFENNRHNIDSMMTELERIGRRDFRVTFNDLTYANNDWQLEVLKDNVYLHNTQWSYFDSASVYDYSINVNLERIDNDYNIHRRQKFYSDSVITGYTSGKDEAGNLEQVPIRESLSAKVNERVFTFMSTIDIEVEIIFNRTGETVASEEFSKTVQEKYTVGNLLHGDKRAIPEYVFLNNHSDQANGNSFDYSELNRRSLLGLGRSAKYYIRKY